MSDVEKQKEPITQSIRNRREHRSRFKVMFYVIGSENSKSGSAFYSSRQQNQRRSGAVRHFRCTDTVSDEPTYGGTLVFSCATIIQIHHLSVKFLNVSHCIRNFKEQFSTGEKKIPLLVRTFRSDLSTGFGKDFEKLSHIPPEETFKFAPYLTSFLPRFFMVFCAAF